VRSGPVAVVPYDPAWSGLFEDERALLERVLAPWLEGGVHHIGVNGDPRPGRQTDHRHDGGVSDLEEARAAFEPLTALSYVHTPHRPSVAHHFSKPSTQPGEVTHGLHLTEPGSDLWRERLAFRDALRQDPALAPEYEAIKRRLAHEYTTDIGAYTVGKREFVGAVLESAGLRFGRR
jgi:GrpB-like predicted nucleotidyltransferase (UPF0157 family)